MSGEENGLSYTIRPTDGLWLFSAYCALGELPFRLSVSNGHGRNEPRSRVVKATEQNHPLGKPGAVSPGETRAVHTNPFQGSAMLQVCVCWLTLSAEAVQIHRIDGPIWGRKTILFSDVRLPIHRAQAHVRERMVRHSARH